MAHTFPIAETPENLITYAEGNQVVVPDSALGVPVRSGRVVRLNTGKPGGTMIVTIEPISAERSAG